MLCPYYQSANTTEGSGLHSLFRHSSAPPFARACFAVRTLFFVGFAARTLPAHGFTASLPVTWDAGGSRAALRIHTSCDATCITGIAEVRVKTCKNRTEATPCCPFLYSGNANSISDGSSASLAPFKILSIMLIVCRGTRYSATPASRGWTCGTEAAIRRHKSCRARHVLPFVLLTLAVLRENPPPHHLYPHRSGPKVPVPPIAEMVLWTYEGGKPFSLKG
jgi:hypothetical protein